MAAMEGQGPIAFSVVRIYTDRVVVAVVVARAGRSYYKQPLSM
jgi:hypothetical protein